MHLHHQKEDRGETLEPCSLVAQRRCWVQIWISKGSLDSLIPTLKMTTAPLHNKRWQAWISGCPPKHVPLTVELSSLGAAQEHRVTPQETPIITSGLFCLPCQLKLLCSAAFPAVCANHCRLWLVVGRYIGRSAHACMTYMSTTSTWAPPPDTILQQSNISPHRERQ